MVRQLTVLHLAPHPDDELIGAPATLLGLRDAGHRIINIACSLGRAEHAVQRRAEIEAACQRARFELIILEPPASLSRGDDLDDTQRRLVATFKDLLASTQADIVIAPSPHDIHHGHEVVGRAARDAVRGSERTRLWLWALWSELPRPTLFVPFDDPRMEEILHSLAAHVGELTRNDYRDLVAGRSLAARVRGPELIFGFGEPGRPGRFAELLTEVVPDGRDWRMGEPRCPDLSRPLAPLSAGRPLAAWIDAPSPSALLQ